MDSQFNLLSEADQSRQMKQVEPKRASAEDRWVSESLNGITESNKCKIHIV